MKKFGKNENKETEGTIIREGTRYLNKKTEKEVMLDEKETHREDKNKKRKEQMKKEHRKKERY